MSNLSLQADPHAYLVFDDTVLDKRFARSIELTRRQYSGNAHRVIRGIGLVSCLYVNALSGQFWVIDYRIYDRDGDGRASLTTWRPCWRRRSMARADPSERC